MKKTNKFIALLCATSLLTSSASAGIEEVFEPVFRYFIKGVSFTAGEDVYNTYLRPYKREVAVATAVIVIGYALLKLSKNKEQKNYR